MEYIALSSLTRKKLQHLARIHQIRRNHRSAYIRSEVARRRRWAQPVVREVLHESPDAPESASNIPDKTRPEEHP